VYTELNKFLSENSLEVASYPGLSESHANEITRFGVIEEFHNTSSFMGGVASQEVIKIITHQWIPANNTFIYNGLAGNAQTLEF
jgi:NEDD8-activating enzyme E1 regulatory subunit